MQLFGNIWLTQVCVMECPPHCHKHVFLLHTETKDLQTNYTKMCMDMKHLIL